jgi:hypothetical protein
MAKFNHKNSLTVVLVLVSVALISQSSGYLGKRFSAGYGFYASPGYIGSRGLTSVNMLHEGFIEVAAKKRISIGLSARFYNAAYGNTRYVDVLTSNSSKFRQLDDNPSGQTNIKGKNYLLYFKFFRQNYVAPWGRYFILGATVNTFQSSYNPNEMTIRVLENKTYSDYSDFGFTKQNYTRFDLMLGFGRCRIISNRVTMDYGYNINLMAMALTLFDVTDDDPFDSDELTPAYYIEKTSAARVRGVNRFNVFLKVGVLLF